MLALLGSKLKLYGYAIGMALIAALWITIKVLSGRLEDAKYEARKYRHQVRQRKAVDTADAEIDRQDSDLKRQLEQDKVAGKWPENLRK